jgi:hypothetical protein
MLINGNGWDYKDHLNPYYQALITQREPWTTIASKQGEVELAVAGWMGGSTEKKRRHQSGTSPTPVAWGSKWEGDAGGNFSVDWDGSFPHHLCSWWGQLAYISYIRDWKNKKMLFIKCQVLSTLGITENKTIVFNYSSVLSILSLIGTINVQVFSVHGMKRHRVHSNTNPVVILQSVSSAR